MRVRNSCTFKFIKYVGLINWLIIIPYIIYILVRDMSFYPDPTLTGALLFITSGFLVLILFLGSYVFVPLSYLAVPILLIYDIVKKFKTKTCNQTNTTKPINYYIDILGIIGFILGGIVAFRFAKFDIM